MEDKISVKQKKKCQRGHEKEIFWKKSQIVNPLVLVQKEIGELLNKVSSGKLGKKHTIKKSLNIK